MSSSFGNNIKITLFGESHGPAVGITIDGLPAGETIDFRRIDQFMARRAPGSNLYVSTRREGDQFRILSGLFEEKTCGSPLTAIIENRDARTGDYDETRFIPRPGQSDYTTFAKYGHRDHRGGGHLSGRLTAPLCFAGAICGQLLIDQGIDIGAHIQSIGPIQDRRFDTTGIQWKELRSVASKRFPVLDDDAGEEMRRVILESKERGDSLGGIIECCALGVPPGLGDPIFDGIENRLAAAIFAIPSVKGIEFGEGFHAATLSGSEHNDDFIMRDDTVGTRTNRHGGILGGISSGMPLHMAVAIKPTPSIAKPQQSVDLRNHKEVPLKIGGRHDPCIVLRAVPCVEAVTAIVLFDMWLDAGKR